MSDHEPRGSPVCGVASDYKPAIITAGDTEIPRKQFGVKIRILNEIRREV